MQSGWLLLVSVVLTTVCVLGELTGARWLIRVSLAFVMIEMLGCLVSVSMRWVPLVVRLVEWLLVP